MRLAIWSTTTPRENSTHMACFLFATGIAPGRLASYRINGETGALTPLAGQCPADCGNSHG
jgi:hypothetical protein